MYDEDLKLTILQELKEKAIYNRFLSYEIPRAVHLTHVPFTPENEILTPTFKMRRNIAKRVFEKELKELYDKANNNYLS